MGVVRRYGHRYAQHVREHLHPAAAVGPAAHHRQRLQGPISQLSAPLGALAHGVTDALHHRVDVVPPGVEGAAVEKGQPGPLGQGRQLSGEPRGRQQAAGAGGQVLQLPLQQIKNAAAQLSPLRRVELVDGPVQGQAHGLQGKQDHIPLPVHSRGGQAGGGRLAVRHRAHPAGGAEVGVYRPPRPAARPDGHGGNVRAAREDRNPRRKPQLPGGPWR